MRHRNIAIAAIGLTLLSGAAMAQGNGKPRFDVGEQGNTAFGATLPSTPGSRPDWNYEVGASVPSWSSNPHFQQPDGRARLRRPLARPSVILRG
jgi:hypothetical protein